MAAETKQSFLEVVVPVADYRDLKQPVFGHAPRPGSITGRTVALLPSEKSSSPPFMQALTRRLAAETDVKRAVMHNPDWPFFHPQRTAAIAPEIDKLARECDLVVLGVAY
jgi:hypothetical protein